jgi:hypothetical protein
MDKNFIYQERSIKKSNAWLMFLLLGWSYGSYDKMGKQIFYYLTLGGLGLWCIYKLFTLNRDIIEWNKKVAQQAGFTSDEMMQLGLY